MSPYIFQEENAILAERTLALRSLPLPKQLFKYNQLSLDRHNVSGF